MVRYVLQRCAQLRDGLYEQFLAVGGGVGGHYEKAAAPSGATGENQEVGVPVSATAIDILESHDIVFGQVRAALDFDEHQVDLARLFQAMLVAGRNEGGF